MRGCMCAHMTLCMLMCDHERARVCPRHHACPVREPRLTQRLLPEGFQGDTAGAPVPSRVLHARLCPGAPAGRAALVRGAGHRQGTRAGTCGAW